MQVKANVGWLKSAFDKTIIGYAIPDFLEVMAEEAGYLEISNYDVIPNREAPRTSRAMTGVTILGKKFFAQCFKKP